MLPKSFLILLSFLILVIECQGQCGNPSVKNSGLVFGGESFSRGKWPWMTALYKRTGEKQSFFCAGTLISKKKVVTAAHCIYEKFASEPKRARDVILIFGAYNLNEPSGTYSATASQIVLHDDWNPYVKNFDADIAMIFIEDEVPVTKFIQPVCLWSSNNYPNIGEGYIAGWGKSETSDFINPIPKQLKIPIKSQEECFIGNPEFAVIASKRTFCGGSRDGSGPCLGDSGSGMFIEYQNIFYLRGIVSSSIIDHDTKCDVTNYALYTDILKYLPWIRNPFVIQRPVEKPPVENAVCGEMGFGSGLIQGGYAAHRDIFPWTVAVEDSQEASFDWNVLKTGTLISKKHVIVPAGFVSYSNDEGDSVLISVSRLTLYFGAHVLKYKSSPPAQSSSVSRLIRHPNYKNGNPREANIAIAVATNEVQFSDSIKPVCIAPFRESSDDLIGTYGFGVGWGMSENLKLSESKKYLKMKIIPQSQCESEHTQKSVIFAKYFCASTGSNETTCFGDDPMYFKTGSRWYLRGLWTGFYKLGGMWQCNPKYSILYEDVAPYSKWINEQIRKY